MRLSLIKYCHDHRTSNPSAAFLIIPVYSLISLEVSDFKVSGHNVAKIPSGFDPNSLVFEVLKIDRGYDKTSLDFRIEKEDITGTATFVLENNIWKLKNVDFAEN